MRAGPSLIVAAACIAALAGPAAAHPHFRFSYQVEPLMQAQALVGLRVHWWVDAVASAQIRHAADLNRDGRLDADELAAFARGNDRLLRPQRYFIRVDDASDDTSDDVGLALAAEPPTIDLDVSQPLGAVDEGDAGIRLHFEMRFSGAAPAAFGVRFFDPTWNVALAPHAALLPVAASATTACRAEHRTQTLATVGWGEQQVARLVFRCAPAEPVRLQARRSVSPRTHPEEIKK
jgi:ABC-type uncharacterized transport system substrate-binding protein